MLYFFRGDRMKKLSQIPAPAIAGVVREKNARSAMGEIKNCMFHGADMIDLHLSCLEKSDTDTLKTIISSSRLPVLALHYNRTLDFGEADYSEEERVDALLRAVDAGAAGIDIQGYTFHRPSQTGFYGEDVYSFTSGKPKEVVTDAEIISRQCALIEQVHARGAEVLLSCHPGIPMKAEQVVELALFLEKRKPDIIKIVTTAAREDDVLESLRAMLLLKREVKTPVSYHANGPLGGLSRVLNPALGGQIAFCVDRFSETSTMEQLDLQTAKAVIDGLKKLM